MPDNASSGDSVISISTSTNPLICRNLYDALLEYSVHSGEHRRTPTQCSPVLQFTAKHIRLPPVEMWVHSFIDELTQTDIKFTIRHIPRMSANAMIAHFF